ncbi:MAG TPA: type IV secretion system DNA-binding domain-containing protein, partial [bacterium]|nr:type IV secretion system DNA-binding domain-containing protein [bacterium]
ETRHFFLGGSIGSGKSLGIKELLAQARNAGQRAIVYDISGEFVEVFYRKDKDIIFNPLDKRSVITKGWSLFKEIDQMYDLDSVAATLIPQSKGDASPYFIEAAQSVLASLMKRLMETGQETNERLYYYVAKAPIEELAAILEGTEGSSHIGSGTDPKTASNVRSTLTTKLRILGYLKDCDAASDFSLRKWVTENSDSWIFITSRQAQQATLAPLLAFAIDRIGTFLLSLEPDRTRRIWISLDELSSLPRVQIETIMDKGRKYGACVLIGLQNINQLRDVYGEETAASLLSNCLTWVIYRTSDPTTAEYMSKKLGEQEIYEYVASTSQKGSLVVETNGKNITKQRTKKEIVLPSEIMNLDERIAYIKVEGNFPVVKTEFPIIQRKAQAPAFEAVDFSIQRGTPAAKRTEKEYPVLAPEDGTLSDDDEPPVG